MVGSSEPTVIDYSEAEAVDEITPALTKYLAIGLLLGLIAACGLICVRYMTDTTLKTEDDLEEISGYPSAQCGSLLRRKERVEDGQKITILNPVSGSCERIGYTGRQTEVIHPHVSDVSFHVNEAINVLRKHPVKWKQY